MITADAGLQASRKIMKITEIRKRCMHKLPNDVAEKTGGSEEPLGAMKSAFHVNSQHRFPSTRHYVHK